MVRARITRIDAGKSAGGTVRSVIEAMVAVVGTVGGLTGIVVLYDGIMGRRRAKRDAAIDPVRVLELRLAEGEIDEDDFNRRMHRLRMGPPLELE